MANLLILNQPYVSVGLTTSTFTIPSTGLYSLRFSSTVPAAAPADSGAGSGVGRGSGRGGGDQYGFAKGGGGAGQGSEGEGFGADNSGYQQPPSAGSTVVALPDVQSALVVVVNQNSSPVFTSPTLALEQSHLEFSLNLVCTAADTISVVMTSANASDAVLNGLRSTVAINQGLKQ